MATVLSCTSPLLRAPFEASILLKFIKNLLLKLGDRVLIDLPLLKLPSKFFRRLFPGTEAYLSRNDLRFIKALFFWWMKELYSLLKLYTSSSFGTSSIFSRSLFRWLFKPWVFLHTFFFSGCSIFNISSLAFSGAGSTLAFSLRLLKSPANGDGLCFYSGIGGFRDCDLFKPAKRFNAGAALGWTFTGWFSVLAGDSKTSNGLGFGAESRPSA